MVGFYISIGWSNNCFDDQVVKFQKSQFLGAADYQSLTTIYLGDD